MQKPPEQTTRDDQIEISARFWATVDTQQFRQIIERDGLDAEQCARLWRMLDRQDEPPPFLKIFVKREDVMRIWPPRKK